MKTATIILSKLSTQISNDTRLHVVSFVFFTVGVVLGHFILAGSL